MKDYPSILRISEEFIGKECISFMKLDGSNLRVEFSSKTGFYKWGTRNRLFDASDPEYGRAIPIFHKKYAQDLEKLISRFFPKCKSAIFYMEFFGPESFAGQHNFNKDFDLVIFDINIYKKGFLDPKTFIKICENIHTPEIIYQGKLTEEFVKDIREKKYPVEEGVVCKGMLDPKNIHSQWRCKIKTWEYLAKIKKTFGAEYQKYWE